MNSLNFLLLYFRLFKFSYGFKLFRFFIKSNSLLSAGVKYINNGDTVIDIGANNGGSSLLFSALVGKSGSVYAFEPNSAIAKQLLFYVDLNFFKNISAYSLGLGSQNTFKKFYIDGRHGSQASTFDIIHRDSEIKNNKAIFNETLVQVRTLDSFNFSRIDFIKIDVEGLELEVLIGGMDTIRKFNPIIYLECFFDDRSPVMLEKKYSLSSIFKELNYSLDIIECFTTNDFVCSDNIDLTSISFKKNTGIELLARPFT